MGGRRRVRNRTLRAGLVVGVMGLIGAIGTGCGRGPTAGAASAATRPSAVPTTTSSPVTLAPATLLPAAPSRETTLPEPQSPEAPSSEPQSPVTSQPAAPAADTPVVDSPVADSPVAVMLPTPAAPPADPHAAEQRIGIGSIEIPRIGVNKPMFEGVTLTTLDRGPGHWPGTAMPGQPGNVVVGGHRVSHDRPFRNIDRLTPGDEVIFTTDAGRFVYRVVGTEIVTPDAIRIIDQTPSPTATLFACTPPGSTSHRIVVHLALST